MNPLHPASSSALSKSSVGTEEGNKCGDQAVAPSSSNRIGVRPVLPRCPLNHNQYKEHLCAVLNIPTAPVIDLTEYIDCGTYIAAGGSGLVYKGKWKCINHIPGDDLQVLPNVAVKVIKIPSLKDERQKVKRLKKMKRELELWSKLNHDNVLPLVGFARIDDDFNLPAFISPWIQFGCVLEFLKEMPLFPVSLILWDIVHGLNYLHTFNPEIVHGDLKAANVLITSRFEACLCDFGLSRFAVDNSLWRTSSTQVGGTLRWMAPELLDGVQTVPTKASDIYALAMTSYEILSRAPPFETTKFDPAVISKVLKGDRPDRNDVCRLDALWTLITRCWAQEAEDRPQIGEVLILMWMCTVMQDVGLLRQLTSHECKIRDSLGRLYNMQVALLTIWFIFVIFI